MIKEKDTLDIVLLNDNYGILFLIRVILANLLLDLVSLLIDIDVHCEIKND